MGRGFTLRCPNGIVSAHTDILCLFIGIITYIQQQATGSKIWFESNIINPEYYDL